MRHAVFADALQAGVVLVEIVDDQARFILARHGQEQVFAVPLHRHPRGLTGMLRIGQHDALAGGGVNVLSAFAGRQHQRRREAVTFGRGDGENGSGHKQSS
ncbi:hypothetical protein [Pantoea endophytica]|uniref:hypothetical protein n=1 Tax=Pantoea endophytica TaxID=92488 RepID=UPI0013043559|nr:hypothetical protein [Pantoea endophytica]